MQSRLRLHVCEVVVGALTKEVSAGCTTYPSSVSTAGSRTGTGAAMCAREEQVVDASIDLPLVQECALSDGQRRWGRRAAGGADRWALTLLRDDLTATLLLLALTIHEHLLRHARRPPAHVQIGRRNHPLELLDTAQLAAAHAAIQSHGAQPHREHRHEGHQQQAHPADVLLRLVADRCGNGLMAVGVEHIQRLHVVLFEADARVVLREREHDRGSHNALRLGDDARPRLTAQGRCEPCASARKQRMPRVLAGLGTAALGIRAQRRGNGVGVRESEHIWHRGDRTGLIEWARIRQRWAARGGGRGGGGARETVAFV